MGRPSPPPRPPDAPSASAGYTGELLPLDERIQMVLAQLEDGDLDKSLHPALCAEHKRRRERLTYELRGMSLRQLKAAIKAEGGEAPRLETIKLNREHLKAPLIAQLLQLREEEWLARQQAPELHATARELRATVAKLTRQAERVRRQQAMLQVRRPQRSWRGGRWGARGREGFRGGSCRGGS